MTDKSLQLSGGLCEIVWPTILIQLHAYHTVSVVSYFNNLGAGRGVK